MMSVDTSIRPHFGINREQLDALVADGDQAAIVENAYRAQVAWSDFPVCVCWSCNQECGGTQHHTSCGLAIDVDGQPICAACREKAQVFGTDADRRSGTRVELVGEHVTLTGDVFDTFGKSTLAYTAASARHLAQLLTAAASDLDTLAAAAWVRS
jgi:hypothetical protein